MQKLANVTVNVNRVLPTAQSETWDFLFLVTSIVGTFGITTLLCDLNFKDLYDASAGLKIGLNVENEEGRV